MKEDTEILRIFIRESMILQEDESAVGPGWGAITGTAELGYGLQALKFLGELYDSIKKIAIHGINMAEIFATTLVNTGLVAAEGVSSTSTVCHMRRRPKPLTHSLCFGNLPFGERTRVTLIIFLAMIYYPTISSTDLPRLAAISSGDFMAFRPLIVARTTFTGLVEP